MRVNDSPVQDGLDRRAAPISIPVFPRVPHHVRRGISSNTVADPVSLSYSFRAFGVRAGDHAVLDRGFLKPLQSGRFRMSRYTSTRSPVTSRGQVGVPAGQDPGTRSACLPRWMLTPDVEYAYICTRFYSTAAVTRNTENFARLRPEGIPGHFRGPVIA